MGCTVSHGLSAEDVEAYETCSFFTATEVIQALQIFVTIANNPKCDDPKSITLPSATVAKWRGLCHNPFARRICDVFSDDDGEFSFDEFLDMLSVFSEHAPKDVKATYAFRIYDRDGDGWLGREDVLNALVLMQVDDADVVLARIFKEADPVQPHLMSVLDFKKMVYRVPGFVDAFAIRLYD